MILRYLRRQRRAAEVEAAIEFACVARASGVAFPPAEAQQLHRDATRRLAIATAKATAWRVVEVAVGAVGLVRRWV